MVVAAVDDYAGVVGPRAKDTRALLQAGRHVAAQHVGGVVIECVIKAGAVRTPRPGCPVPLTHWRDTLHPHCPQNPRHDLNAAMSLLPPLVQARLRRDPQFVASLREVQNPNGLKGYIDMRYHPHAPTVGRFNGWRDSYHYVVRKLHDELNAHFGTRTTWRM